MKNKSKIVNAEQYKIIKKFQESRAELLNNVYHMSMLLECMKEQDGNMFTLEIERENLSYELDRIKSSLNKLEPTQVIDSLYCSKCNTKVPVELMKQQEEELICLRCLTEDMYKNYESIYNASPNTFNWNRLFKKEDANNLTQALTGSAITGTLNYQGSYNTNMAHNHQTSNYGFLKSK